MFIRHMWRMSLFHNISKLWFQLNFLLMHILKHRNGMEEGKVVKTSYFILAMSQKCDERKNIVITRCC